MCLELSKPHSMIKTQIGNIQENIAFKLRRLPLLGLESRR